MLQQVPAQHLLQLSNCAVCQLCVSVCLCVCVFLFMCVCVVLRREDPRPVYARQVLYQVLHLLALHPLLHGRSSKRFVGILYPGYCHLINILITANHLPQCLFNIITLVLGVTSGH